MPYLTASAGAGRAPAGGDATGHRRPVAPAV